MSNTVTVALVFSHCIPFWKFLILIRSELISALSAEMRAKFEELRGENTALKDRITLLESGLSRKIDSLSSELEELKKRVRLLYIRIGGRCYVYTL